LGFLLGFGELLRHGFAIRDETTASALSSHGILAGSTGGRPPNASLVGTLQGCASRQRVLATATRLFLNK
jgi:hypothetical protein